jgi:hypothetical protein
MIDCEKRGGNDVKSVNGGERRKISKILDKIF